MGANGKTYPVHTLEHLYKTKTTIKLRLRCQRS